MSTISATMIALLVSTSVTASNPHCTMRHPAKYYDSISELPKAVQKELDVQLKGRLASPSEPFDGSDFSIQFEDADGKPDASVHETYGASRRLIKVVESDGKWFVWYLHGGRGVHTHVLAFDIGVSGHSNEPVAILGANFVADNPCAATDASLDGVSPALDGEW